MGAMSFANVGCAAAVSEANSRTNDIAIVSTDVRHPAVPHVCSLLMAYSCAAPTVATHVDTFDVADQASRPTASRPTATMTMRPTGRISAGRVFLRITRADR